MVKTKELVSPIGALTFGGFGTVFGARMVESMPSTAATSGVAGGFTRFAGFYPLMATGSVMGISMKQFGKIHKQTKKLY